MMQEAISKLMYNKTVIVIAHRLSTVVKADNIFVINKGDVAESGTHQELLELNGLYNKMWNAHIRSKNWNMTKKEGLA
jgi:ATP-binding cassette subfamily B protein